MNGVVGKLEYTMKPLDKTNAGLLLSYVVFNCQASAMFWVLHAGSKECGYIYTLQYLKINAFVIFRFVH